MANLKTNTTTIQSILETVNNLPEAGSGGIIPTGTINIDKNGECDVTNYAKANVNVPSTIPTGYADVSGVTATTAHVLSTVKFVPKEGGDPVSGSIPTKSNNDLTSSGATITGPAGYYSSGISKSVSTATKATPTISKTSTGKLKASYNQSAGYVTSGIVNGSEVSASSLDTNLTAGNIKSGVTIFGVKGSYSGGGGYVGEFISTTRTNNTTLTFNVNTNNLIGFAVIAKSTLYMDADTTEGIVAFFYFNNNTYTTYYEWDADENAATTITVVNNTNTTHTIGSGTVTLTTSQTNRFKSDATYYLFPMYSA